MFAPTVRFNHHGVECDMVSQWRDKEIKVNAVLLTLETDIDQCLGMLSVLLTHNDFDLINQEDLQMCLSIVDEKLRKIKGGVGL